MVRNNIVLIVGFCLSILTVSCSQSEPENVSKNDGVDERTIKSNNEVYIEKSKITALKGIEKNIEKPTSLGKKTISFNGEKYIFDGKKLRKGSKVRNINMSESGRIKGSIVVVVKADETLDVPFKSKTKIAKNTYRLIPAQTDDLMIVYKELMSNKSITIVELEVIYSGNEKEALAY